jgi:hypothetical protein
LGPFRSFRLTPLFPSSAEQHGGASSLLLPDGTLAKGICHHFVRTVSHLALRRKLSSCLTCTKSRPLWILRSIPSCCRGLASMGIHAGTSIRSQMVSIQH